METQNFFFIFLSWTRTGRVEHCLGSITIGKDAVRRHRRNAKTKGRPRIWTVLYSGTSYPWKMKGPARLLLVL